MTGGSRRLPDPLPTRTPLDAAGQQIADDILRWLRHELPTLDRLRSCAEQAVSDLRQSVSEDALPEMATRLTLVRLADIPVAVVVEREPGAGPALRLVPDTGSDLSGADL